MDLDLEPGKYDIVAWATGKSPMTDAVNFQIGGNGDPNAPAELTATLPLNGQAGSYSQDKDITPLFWGHASDVECGAKDYGTITLPTIDLMKDTNIIKVILQNLDGSEMKEGDFRIEIEADNSRMDYMNNIIPFGKVSYGAWSSTLLKLDNGETKATHTARARRPVLRQTDWSDAPDRIIRRKRSLLSTLLRPSPHSGEAKAPPAHHGTAAPPQDRPAPYRSQMS